MWTLHKSGATNLVITQEHIFQKISKQKQQQRDFIDVTEAYLLDLAAEKEASSCLNML